MLALQKFKVTDLIGLKDCLAAFDRDVLFRGQTRNFGTPAQPSATTSFDRHGCIPSEMLRWSRFADEVLAAFTGQHSNLALNQAILQHYGFRSFYLDCSDRAHVSAWFAGNLYTSRPILELCEDCDERPIHLSKKMASYRAADGAGHLYLLDRVACEKAGLTDLTAIAIKGTRTRASVQSAYLIGPLRNAPLPDECFLAHIEADCAIFREFAAEAGLGSTDSVFPPSTDDPILEALLSLPWTLKFGAADSIGGIPTFRRVIELPEYEESFTKIASTAVAFYRGGRITDFLGKVDGFSAGAVVQVPEITLLGSPDHDFPRLYPKVMALLQEHESVVFEASLLFKFPQHSNRPFYQKGVALNLIEPALVHVGALMVRHPGQEIDAAGVNRGWFYRVGEDGIWRREPSGNDCPCDSEWLHERHMISLYIIEQFLSDPAKFAE